MSHVWALLQSYDNALDALADRLREQIRSKPHHRLRDDLAAGDEPTLYRRWIGAVARHFGAEAIGRPVFELPRAWEFEVWRSRRVLGELKAESA